jgi:predicted DNA-binding protein YlxM (UPF0122 family)
VWARKYKKCTKCGTTKVKHLSRGLCVKCYHKEVENKHKQHIRKHGIASKKLTKEYLVNHYFKGKKSLSDIAEESSCSRQFVYKKMLEYEIPRRTLRSARKMALKQKKIIVNRLQDDGHIQSVIYQKIEYNGKFFASWSQKMAYVLGILYTDGCLSMSIHHGKKVTRRTPIISFAQKERELVAKVLALMDCNAKIHHHKRRIYGGRVCGAVYYFSLACSAIYPDLVRLGLKTTKSLDIEFPTIPQQYARHFIKGCWDGDGTVYYEKSRSNYIRGGFYSGSFPFIKGMLTQLEKTGLPKRTVYIKQGKHPSYYFRFTGSQCIKLYHYLYDDVPPTQCLERKHSLFKKYADQQRAALKETKYRQISIFKP